MTETMPQLLKQPATKNGYILTKVEEACVECGKLEADTIYTVEGDVFMDCLQSRYVKEDAAGGDPPKT